MLLLLEISSHLSGCSASSSRRFSTALPQAFKSASRRGDNRRNNNSARDALELRGGSDGGAGGSTGSYHGNYISQTGATPTAIASGGATTLVAPVEPEVIPSPVASPVLASAASTNSKLSNLQERTGPAVLMLSAITLLLKFTGSNGLIGLVFVMQMAMYSESTSVVDDFSKKGNEGIDSFPLQKWWWFATAMMMTSGRKMLTELTSVTMNQMNLITFGMSAISLVGGVISLAMLSGDAVDNVYRSYLGKVASCHFSLLFLVGQSSFWINTVKEYGLVWVIFPAILVVVNDTMAYVFGVLLGKHKLLPRLSPKKTVEGFVGAGISTMAIAGPLFRKMVGTDGVVSAGRHALTLALYVSLVSPFGGFLASATKRAHGAKDFGALIPGHGGVVDRFDCQVVTAPFVYLYLKNAVGSAL